MFDFDFLIYKGYKGIFKLIYDVEISVLLLLIVNNSLNEFIFCFGNIKRIFRVFSLKIFRS